MYLEFNWRVNASSWTSWVRCGWGRGAGRRRPCPGRTSPAPGSPAPIRGEPCAHVTWCAAVIGHLEHVAEAQPTELGRHRGGAVAGHQVGGGSVAPHLHLQISTLVCSFVAIIIRNHLSFLLILPGANPVIRADSALFRMLRLTETIDKYDLDCWCIYKETFNLFTVKKPWFVEFPWGLLCGHFAIVHTHTSKCFWQLSFTYVITTSLRGWWWHFKKCLIRNVHDAHDTLYYCKENKEKSLSLTEGILGKNLQNIRGFIHTFRKW